MAKSRPEPKKRGSVTNFPTPQSDVAVEDPPEVEQPAPEAAAEPQTPFDTPTEPAPRKIGRPKKGDEPIETNFFQKLREIPSEEWGTRVYLYLYQLEPVCDLKQSGGKAYLMRYQRPIQDEQEIMLEQGSGKYRLVLAKNKVSPLASNELARYEFEIYNPKYPPKIPRRVWINDPRNTRWEALLPPEPAPAPPATGLGTLVEAMGVLNDIRQGVKEELTPESAPAAPVAPQPVDPWSAAEKILNMRSDNPMVGILQAQLTASAAAVEAERDRNFKAQEAAREREFKLQQQLMEAKTGGSNNKGLVEQLIELAPAIDKLKPLLETFGFGRAAEAATTRAVKSTAYDMVKDIAASPFGQQVGAGIGMLLGSLAQRGATANGQPVQQPQAPPIILNAQQPNGTAQPENTEQRMARIGQQIGYGMVYEYFLKDLSGEEFAEAMFNLHPEDVVFMQRLGAEDIVRRCRMVPAVWNVVAPKEPAFIEFIQEFCAWNQQAEESEPPQGAKQTDNTGVEMEDELS